MSIPSATTVHPSWCHPSTCRPHLHEDGSVDYEHREPAMMLRPFAHRDIELAVFRSRIDDLGEVPSINPVRITLLVVDPSRTLDGKPVTIDVDLSPADVRMLTAALGATASEVAEEVSAAR